MRHPDLLIALCCVALVGCDDWSETRTTPPPVPVLVAGGEESTNSVAAHALGEHDDHDDHAHHHHHDEEHHAHVVLTPEIRHEAARILVLQSTHTDQVTEVVGVVDVHADSGDQDEALDELRAVAMSMGADAVLGVEFHHGETHDAPTHLSGLAVRFLTRVPNP